MSRSREVPAQEMKTIPISQFRRDCVDLLDAASRAGAPLVVTRRGKPVARVLPFPGTTAQLEPAGALLKDRMEFAGDGVSPVEASWGGLR
jgi:prevent-host-death family protein